MKTMKYIIVVAIVLLSGCTMSTQDKYEVVGISEQNENMVKYELKIVGWAGSRNRIWDTTGKYKVGDTVYITLKTK